MDREKVISELTECIDHIRFGEFNKIPLWGNCQIAMMDAVSLLKNQNTRRCGKWKTIPHKKARVCSVCEKDEPYKFADDDADVYDYCPHCGAKMEGR